MTFPIIALAIALVCTVVSFAYPADSSGFPRVMSVLLLVLAVMELLKVFRAGNVFELKQEQTAQWRAALLVFASAPFYIALARLFDFEIATYVYLLSGMLVLGVRRPVTVVVVSISTLLIVKVLFFTLLDVTRAPTVFFGS